MTQNANAFVQLSTEPQALQFFAQNMDAFAKLGHDANFQNLVSNAAFSTAARSGDLANAVNSD